MYSLPISCILLAMLLTLIAAIRGKFLYDKILAVNVFGTITVLFIAVFGFLSGRPDFLDIAIVYALINFMTTIAVLKLFAYGDTGRDGDR